MAVSVVNTSVILAAATTYLFWPRVLIVCDGRVQTKHTDTHKHTQTHTNRRDEHTTLSNPSNGREMTVDAE